MIKVHVVVNVEGMGNKIEVVDFVAERTITMEEVKKAMVDRFKNNPTKSFIRVDKIEGGLEIFDEVHIKKEEQAFRPTDEIFETKKIESVSQLIEILAISQEKFKHARVKRPKRAMGEDIMFNILLKGEKAKITKAWNQFLKMYKRLPERLQMGMVINTTADDIKGIYNNDKSNI
jgi:GTPase Era involved in 16S rRNA processing